MKRKRQKVKTQAPSAPAQDAKPTPRINAFAIAASSVRRTPPTTPWTIPKPAPGVAPASASMAMDDACGPLLAYAGNSYGMSGYGGEGLHFLGYPYLAELLLRSEYRRMVSVLAQEMTRRWGRLVSTGEADKSDKIKKLDAAMTKFHVQDVFRDAAEADSAFGIGHIYIDTGDGDNPDELKTPLFARKAKIGKGALKRIRSIEPLWCYPGAYESSDPLSPHFYRPQFWYVMSKSVHHTRLISLVSRAVPDILKPSFMFGGVALTQLAQPSVDNWLQTRKSVSDLLHSFTVWQLKTNMMATLQGGPGDDLSLRAQLFDQYRDNRGLMVIDKETEDLGNISVPLGGLDHLQAQSQEHLAAVDGMPLIKLVGYTPSGLNSTGEGEMDAWRDRVRAQQEHLFNGPLKTVMDVIQLSEFGEIDDEIGWEWLSLEEDNETELASIRKTDVDADVELVNAGVISPEEVRNRLATTEGSVYHGLDVSDVPEPPENEEDPSLLPDPAKAAKKEDNS